MATSYFPSTSAPNTPSLSRSFSTPYHPHILHIVMYSFWLLSFVDDDSRCVYSLARRHLLTWSFHFSPSLLAHMMHSTLSLPLNHSDYNLPFV